MGKKYYAVAKGIEPGIYITWSMAEKQIKGFKGAKFKGFDTEEQAQEYMEKNTQKTVAYDNPKTDFYGDYLSSSNECVAYVDGSCSTGKVSSGVVMLFGNSTNSSSLTKYANVAGELNASLSAITTAIKCGFKKVTVFYDYLGIEYWVTGEWKCKTDIAKKYRDTVNKLKEEIEIDFVHVRGHCGIYGNELADELAKHSLGIKVKK